MLSTWLLVQSAAIQDFPKRLGTIKAEHKVRQDLVTHARRDCLRVRKELARKGSELEAANEQISALEETMAELRALQQGGSEVAHPPLRLRQAPLCLGALTQTLLRHAE